MIPVSWPKNWDLEVYDGLKIALFPRGLQGRLPAVIKNPGRRVGAHFAFEFELLSPADAIRHDFTSFRLNLKVPT